MAKSIQYLAWGSITSGDRWTEPPIPSQLWLFSDCHFHGLSPCWSLTHLNGFDNGFHHPSSMVLLDPTWRLPLACLLENLFMGNDRLFRPSEFALGSVNTAECYMWGQNNFTSYRVKAFLAEERIHPLLLGQRGHWASQTTPEFSEAEKGKATDWGPGQWPRGAVLTHKHQVAIVLQHHIPVQGLLNRGQELPLLPREVHGHVVKCEGFL